MPVYLVELPEHRRVQDVNVQVVFAADEAGARSAAAGRFPGDAAGLWNTVATVTEVVVGLDLADSGHEDWTMYARITGAGTQTVDPFIVDVDGKTRNQAQGVLTADKFHLAEGLIINAAGSGYAIDDILTFTGGTFSRAATARVITVSTGAILTLELVDPGQYTVLPTLTAMASTNSGSGDDAATVDATQAAVNSYEALVAQMVTGLLGSPDISNAAVDFSEGASGARLLTLASIADGIGDAAIEVEVRQNGTLFAPLVSTIVDEGIAAAVLTMAIPASPLVPPRITALKT